MGLQRATPERLEFSTGIALPGRQLCCWPGLISLYDHVYLLRRWRG